MSMELDEIKSRLWLEQKELTHEMDRAWEAYLRAEEHLDAELSRAKEIEDLAMASYLQAHKKHEEAQKVFRSEYLKDPAGLAASIAARFAVGGDVADFWLKRADRKQERRNEN